MSYSSRYKGTIWTNHVLDRLKDRKIPQDMAWKAFQYPDSTQDGKRSGTQEFKKQIGEHAVTTIATQNTNREWIILSSWVYPPFEGSIDIKKRQAYLNYKKSSFLGKVFIQLRRAIGLYDDF